MTPRNRIRVAALAAALLALGAVLVAPAWCPAGQDAPKTPLPKLLERIHNVKENSMFVGPDKADADKLFAEILQGGPADIVALVDMVLEPGKGLDFPPRYAIHGLARYVVAPGRQKQRKLFADALASTLQAKRPKAVLGFVIRQLQIAGGPDATETLGGFLLDDELCDDAAQALAAIGGEGAVAQACKALPKSAGRARRAILRALGDLHDAKSLDAITQALTDADRDTRITAAFALAALAEPAAVEPMLKAAQAEPLFERGQVTAACLLLARNLAEAGKADDAGRIYLQLWKTRTDPADVHVRCAALRGLAEAPGPEALDTIVAALASSDASIQAAAVRAAAFMPGEQATRRWLDELKKAAPPNQVQILRILAVRRDPASVPAVLQAANDKDPAVRIEAVSAAGAIGGKEAVAALLALLDDRDGKVRSAAREACKRTSGDEADAQLADAVAGASAQAKKELLGILSARGAKACLKQVLAAAADPDASVRADAIRAVGTLGGEAQAPLLLKWLVEAKDTAQRDAAQNALAGVCRRAANRDAAVADAVAQLAKADPATKAALIRVLAQVAAPASLGAIRDALKDADKDVHEAAVRALADWPDDDAAKDLLAIAKGSDSETYHVLALRGYVRMIRNGRDARPAQESVKLCREALGLARRPDEKKQVLGVLGEVRTPESLALVMAQIDDAALAEEAGAAASTIAEGLKDADAAVVRSAMEKVLTKCKDRRARDRAQKVLDRLKK